MAPSTAAPPAPTAIRPRAVVVPSATALLPPGFAEPQRTLRNESGMQTRISKERIDAYIRSTKEIALAKNKYATGSIDQLESLHDLRKSKYSERIKAMEKLRETQKLSFKAKSKSISLNQSRISDFEHERSSRNAKLPEPILKHPRYLGFRSSSTISNKVSFMKNKLNLEAIQLHNIQILKDQNLKPLKKSHFSKVGPFENLESASFLEKV